MSNGCLRATFKGALGCGSRCGGRSVLENGFHFPDGPSFLGPYHAHLSTAADQRVRTDLIVDGQDRELGLRLSVEGKVEVARQDPPSRTVIQFDDVGLSKGDRIFMARSCHVGGLKGVVRSATSARTGLARSSWWVGLVGFVMTDHTARPSVELDVASHVASNAADDGALPRRSPRRLAPGEYPRQISLGTRSPPERFDPDAFVRDPLCVGLRPPDERLQPLLQVGGRDLSKPWPILPV